MFDWQNVANMTIDDIWVEHQVCTAAVIPPGL
ncbi:hypothetical protein [Microbispora rosea]